MPEEPNRRQAPPRIGPPANTTALLGLAYMRLGHWIVEAVNAAGFRQRRAHSAVMAHIDVEGGTRLTTIAARANITPQAVGELVDDLEQLGYVVRRPDPNDRRAKRIVLTERGLACVATALEVIVGLEAELAELLGADGLAELHASLGKIIEPSGAPEDR